MGAILDLVQLVQTPIGMIVAIAIVAGIYYFVRWVIKD